MLLKFIIFSAALPQDFVVYTTGFWTWTSPQNLFNWGNDAIYQLGKPVPSKGSPLWKPLALVQDPTYLLGMHSALSVERWGLTLRSCCCVHSVLPVLHCFCLHNYGWSRKATLKLSCFIVWCTYCLFFTNSKNGHIRGRMEAWLVFHQSLCPLFLLFPLFDSDIFLLPARLKPASLCCRRHDEVGARELFWVKLGSSLQQKAFQIFTVKMIKDW